jgi:NAD-dependent SIR2 family protein deacetylase
MVNPYKRMYVLTEEEYFQYKHLKEAAPQEAAKQSINVEIKGSVDPFQCNICGKTFKTKKVLNEHLKQHPPQVQPSTHSIFDSVAQTPAIDIPPSAGVKAKKSHKRSTINFNSSKWLSLK